MNTRKRLLLFKLISILIPFFILFLLEISLRVFHYGYNLDLFVAYPADESFLVFNPEASKKYFTDQQIATTGNVEPFSKKKDANTIRIFVLGESTTIGYPYFHNGSFHRWLQYRLMHSYPDKNFEIVNISLTAVNSYTVWGFSKEVVNYEPDAILIYTGHNEYYGALGVGSTNNLGGNTHMVNLLLALRELKLTQLLTSAYEKIVRSFRSRDGNVGKIRMELMVADQQIPYQSALFNRGIDQFRENMDKTMALFSDHKIPVFISNVVSNEKDMSPFISTSVDSLRYPEFAKNYSLGLKALNDKDEPAAWSLLKKADSVYSGQALCNFYLGRLAYRRGDLPLAKQYFSKAKELDALRFRAPDGINDEISQLCTKYSNVHLVDSKAVFEANSGDHIIGNELILEHVHPNLRGYALLSDVFYLAMKKEHFLPASEGNEMTFPQLLLDMPVTKMDSLAGAYKVFNLKRNWPFTLTRSQFPAVALRDSSAGLTDPHAAPPFPEDDPASTETLPIDSLIPVRSEEEKLAFAITFKHLPWEEAMSNLYDHYVHAQDLENAKTVMEALVLEHPAEVPYYDKTANLCGALKDYPNAIFYFKRSFLLTPAFDKARDLFVICLKSDRPEEALPFLDYAIQNNTAGMPLAPVRKMTAEVIQLKKYLAEDSSNLIILNQIAAKYFNMGNKDGASIYLEKVLKADPGNRQALLLKDQLESGLKNH
jgi:tetratricopeptide (TPR) repeat protein